MYQQAEQIDFKVNELRRIRRPRRVLLTTPDYFDVQYVINPHMEGNIGTVDFVKAREQWSLLRAAYEAIDLEVHTIPGAEDLPDMVFCANQTLPFENPHSNTKGIVLSVMHAPERRPEVPHYKNYFEQFGYSVVELPEDIPDFEGMGDALWHPGRYLLWGGYGFRSDPRVYTFIERELQVPVIALRLEDPDFYHLDTCLSMLDTETCLIYPGAFQPEGLALIHAVFDRVIEAPEDEARALFAVNAHCPDCRHVLIQEGCSVTNERLAAAGFVPIQIATDEFLKAGGSVFCMKQMFW